MLHFWQTRLLAGTVGSFIKRSSGSVVGWNGSDTRPPPRVRRRLVEPRVAGTRLAAPWPTATVTRMLEPAVPRLRVRRALLARVGAVAGASAPMQILAGGDAPAILTGAVDDRAAAGGASEGGRGHEILPGADSRRLSQRRSSATACGSGVGAPNSSARVSLNSATVSAGSRPSAARASALAASAENRPRRSWRASSSFRSSAASAASSASARAACIDQGLAPTSAARGRRSAQVRASVASQSRNSAAGSAGSPADGRGIGDLRDALGAELCGLLIGRGDRGDPTLGLGEELLRPGEIGARRAERGVRLGDQRRDLGARVGGADRIGVDRRLRGADAARRLREGRRTRGAQRVRLRAQRLDPRGKGSQIDRLGPHARRREHGVAGDGEGRLHRRDRLVEGGGAILNAGERHLGEADRLKGKRDRGPAQDRVDLLEALVAAERIVRAAQFGGLGELPVDRQIERPKLLGGQRCGLAAASGRPGQRAEPALRLQAKKDGILGQAFDRFADARRGFGPAGERGVDFGVGPRHG